MVAKTRQSRRNMEEVCSETATPTRRWRRCILDEEDSDENIQEESHLKKLSEPRAQLPKHNDETARAAANSPMDSRAKSDDLVMHLFPSSDPPADNTSHEEPETVLGASLTVDITEPGPKAETSCGAYGGDSEAIELDQRTPQSRADNVDEAEDSGLELPDKSGHTTPEDPRTFNTTLQQRSERCEPSNEASKSPPQLLSKDNIASVSFSETIQPSQEPIELSHPSVSPLTTPPASPTDSKAEFPLANDGEGMVTRPTSAVSSVWDQAMASDAEMKRFEKESRVRREHTRTKNQDGGGEALPRKHGQSNSPTSANDARKHEQMESARGEMSRIVNAPSATQISEISESLESSPDEILPEKEKVKTLSDDIMEAIPRSSRKAFTTGDVAIIIDTGDLTKTLLVSSVPLLEQTSILHGETSHKISPQSPLKYAFVLEVSEDLSSMPKLVSITQSLGESIDLANYGGMAYLCAMNISEIVKDEPSEDSQEKTIEHTPPCIGWIKASEAFLTVVTNTKVPGQRDIDNLLRLIGSNAKVALPQIEGMIEFGKHFEAMEALKTTLTLVIYRYMGSNTLWSAVSEDAASWLAIGLDIQDEAVFKEAFSHVASRLPEWPWYKTKDAIPEDLLTNMEVARNEIEIKHQATQVKLLRLGLTNGNGTTLVSQRNAPYKYDVVCFWSNWIASHFEYVEEKRKIGDLGEPPKSDFCDHSDDTCLNMAKLYRAIGKGGEAYLPFESMMKKWDKKSYGSDEAEQRDALAELKRAASVIVEPMTKSWLQNPLKDELEYLTCIKVEAKDVPWKMHEEYEDGEMEI